MTRSARVPLAAAVLLFLLNAAIAGAQSSELPQAQRGVLDLRSLTLSEAGPLPLRGSWEFYPRRFLETGTGERGSEGAAVPEPEYIRVPAKWSQASKSELSGSAYGYATYRLTILHPDGAPRRLGLYLDSIGTAYELYIDGEPVSQVGTIGTDRASTEPQWKKHVVEFPRRGEETELLFRVANFHDSAGGIHYPLFFGTIEQVYGKRYSKLLLDLFLFGSLLIMSLYHFGLYIHRRKDRSPLYFGFLALLFAIRVVFHNGTYALLLFPDFPWAVQMKIAYLSFALPPMLFYRFIVALYPDYTPRWTLRISDGISGLYSLAILLLPNWIYTRVFEIFLLYIIAVSAAVLYILVRALRDRQSGSLLFATGFLLFFLFILNDIVKQVWGTSTIFMVPIGLLVFIFFQSLVMTRRFAAAFADSERLSEYLMKLNNSMERFVPREFLTFLNKESVMDIELGDHASRDMTVLFADMRGFTSLSEKMTPDDNFRFINSFLRRMGPIIRANHGFVDKYIGDGIMALFPNHPQDAVEAALALRRELDNYNRDRAKSGYRAVNFGIGIHTGELMLGTVGENQRMDGTVISDVVNLASRIEELTRDHELGIAISNEVHAAIAGEERFQTRYVGEERVKGKSKAIRIYEVLRSEEPRPRN